MARFHHIDREFAGGVIAQEQRLRAGVEIAGEQDARLAVIEAEHHRVAIHSPRVAIQHTQARLPGERLNYRAEHADRRRILAGTIARQVAIEIAQPPDVAGTCTASRANSAYDLLGARRSA